MHTIFYVAVVIYHSVPVIISPVANQIVVGIVFVSEVVVRVSIAYEVRVRIGNSNLGKPLVLPVRLEKV
jgi:hypothetical protein